ncbi:Rad2 nuclease [Borealophlyctis nickersoniae]|nr:Rad2 nuclease [Borealophlyctis nickersoniae]
MECFQQCVDVTPRMAYEFIKALRSENVEYMVAPYEADSQLAYLAKSGVVAAVISEDSDLLVFGCRKVIYKLDNEGNGIEVNLDDLGNIPGMKSWTHRRFQQMCIMSGCDYLDSPQGVGVKKAQGFLAHKSAEKVIKEWTTWGKAVNAPPKLPRDYTIRFRKAELTFLHQRVYDPDSGTLVPLTPLPDDFEFAAEGADFLGPDLSPDVAKGIAVGDLDPITKVPFGSVDPSPQKKKSKPKPLPQPEPLSDDDKENIDPALQRRSGGPKIWPVFSSTGSKTPRGKSKAPAQSAMSIHAEKPTESIPRLTPLPAKILNMAPRSRRHTIDSLAKSTPSTSPFFQSLSSLKRQVSRESITVKDICRAKEEARYDAAANDEACANAGEEAEQTVGEDDVDVKGKKVAEMVNEPDSENESPPEATAVTSSSGFVASFQSRMDAFKFAGRDKYVGITASTESRAVKKQRLSDPGPSVPSRHFRTVSNVAVRNSGTPRNEDTGNGPIEDGRHDGNAKSSAALDSSKETLHVRTLTGHTHLFRKNEIMAGIAAKFSAPPFESKSLVPSALHVKTKGHKGAFLDGNVESEFQPPNYSISHCLYKDPEFTFSPRRSCALTLTSDE